MKEKEYQWTGTWTKITYVGWCASIKVKHGDCPRPGDIMRVFKRCGKKYNDVILVELKVTDTYRQYEYWKVDDNVQRVKLTIEQQRIRANAASFGAGQHPIVDISVRAINALFHTKESKAMAENKTCKFAVLIYVDGRFEGTLTGFNTQTEAQQAAEKYINKSTMIGNWTFQVMSGVSISHYANNPTTKLKFYTT